MVWGLPRGEVGIKTVAPRLHMSERTLQRRLHAAGLSFQALLDRTRKELCLDYLSGGRISLDEIAYRLGYANTANFNRAFKRWTGQTPQAYRRRLRQRT